MQLIENPQNSPLNNRKILQEITIVERGKNPVKREYKKRRKIPVEYISKIRKLNAD
jgi:hypothetical protein